MPEAQSKHPCPVCGVRLSQMRNAAGIFWCCPSCDGRMATVALLRKSVLRDVINDIWQQAQQADAVNKRCAECGRPMRQAHVKSNTFTMTVDVCLPCTLVWFDPQEFEALPPQAPATTTAEELPPAAREALAMAKVEAIGQRYNQFDPESRVDDADSPATGWQQAVGLLGMPVEIDMPECNTVPWVTLLLAAIVLAVSLAGFHFGTAFIEKYALIPVQAGRYFGLTLISSFFLHADVIHLLGNLYFLVIFGDNVEDALGKGRFLLLLLQATLLGGVAHIVIDPASSIPCIGASGGISGVLACYALLYPQARLSIFLRAFYIFRWISLPAWGLFLLWIGMQIFGAWQQSQQITNVSAVAHLGGAVMGALCWVVFQRQGVTGDTAAE